MGSGLTFRCECGFEYEMLLGAGMHDFDVYCGMPAICEKCSEFSVSNYYDKDVKCEKCKGRLMYYHVEKSLSLPPKDISLKGFEWDGSEIVLYFTDYKCPKCKNYRMQIDASNDIYWD